MNEMLKFIEPRITAHINQQFMLSVRTEEVKSTILSKGRSKALDLMASQVNSTNQHGLRMKTRFAI